MFLPHVLASARSGPGRLGALCSFLVLLSVVPLADARPPDPVWIAGIYDGADFDDAAQAATSLESQVQSTLYVLSPVLVTVGIMLGTYSGFRFAIPCSTRARAPPKS